MIGPWWLSGHSVQRKFTVEPAGAGACRAAGFEPMMPPVVLPPHSRSMSLVLSMGKLPWISRDMRAGCGVSVLLVATTQRWTHGRVHVRILVWLANRVSRCGDRVESLEQLRGRTVAFVSCLVFPNRKVGKYIILLPSDRRILYKAMSGDKRYDSQQCCDGLHDGCLYHPQLLQVTQTTYTRICKSMQMLPGFHCRGSSIVIGGTTARKTNAQYCCTTLGTLYAVAAPCP